MLTVKEFLESCESEYDVTIQYNFVSHEFENIDDDYKDIITIYGDCVIFAWSVKGYRRDTLVLQVMDRI